MTQGVRFGNYHARDPHVSGSHWARGSPVLQRSAVVDDNAKDKCKAYIQSCRGVLRLGVREFEVMCPNLAGLGITTL